MLHKNNLINFTYESKEIRVILINNEPWWIATDVCDILGIQNTPHAITRLDPDEVTTIVLNDSGNLNGNRNIINESGLYNLMLRSDKPQAKAFKRWITKEVLPSIRKTGSYSLPQSQPTQSLTPYLDPAPMLNEIRDSIKELQTSVTNIRTSGFTEHELYAANILKYILMTKTYYVREPGISRHPRCFETIEEVIRLMLLSKEDRSHYDAKLMMKGLKIGNAPELNGAIAIYIDMCHMDINVMINNMGMSVEQAKAHFMLMPPAVMIDGVRFRYSKSDCAICIPFDYFDKLVLSRM
jgi:prophage antirepressor-like protein